jgi:hypothetical protein
LQLSAGICISSRFDLIVWWGPDLIMLYNDSYRRTRGAKHPFALGRPGREVYPEIWDVIGPMLEKVLQTGEATMSDRNQNDFLSAAPPLLDETGLGSAIR